MISFIFIFKMIKMFRKYSQDEAQALVKALKGGTSWHLVLYTRCMRRRPFL